MSNIQTPIGVNIKELKELEEFALRELKHLHSRNDIILKLCTQAGWDWGQAQRFLDQVYTDHSSELVVREKRWSLLFGVTLILEGLSVFTIGSIGILAPFIYNPRLGRFMIPSMDYPIVPTVIMIFLISPMYFIFFIIIASTGISMVAKGALGIARSI